MDLNIGEGDSAPGFTASDLSLANPSGIKVMDVSNGLKGVGAGISDEVSANSQSFALIYLGAPLPYFPDPQGRTYPHDLDRHR